MLDLRESLLDQITIVHGPYDLLQRYFAGADEITRRAGVQIRFHTDFRRLVELNSGHQASWTPMQPAFDPTHSRLRPDAAFWVPRLKYEKVYCHRWCEPGPRTMVTPCGVCSTVGRSSNSLSRGTSTGGGAASATGPGRPKP